MVSKSENIGDSRNDKVNIYIHKECKKSAEDRTIECDGCTNWLHTECAGLSIKEITMIEKLNGTAKAVRIK